MKYRFCSKILFFFHDMNLVDIRDNISFNVITSLTNSAKDSNADDNLFFIILCRKIKNLFWDVII